MPRLPDTLDRSNERHNASSTRAQSKYASRKKSRLVDTNKENNNLLFEQIMKEHKLEGYENQKDIKSYSPMKRKYVQERKEDWRLKPL